MKNKELSKKNSPRNLIDNKVNNENSFLRKDSFQDENQDNISNTLNSEEIKENNKDKERNIINKNRKIDTVFEYINEENCSNNNYSEYSIENNPIVTFLFYKEESEIDSSKKENNNNFNKSNNNKENITDKEAEKNNDNCYFNDINDLINNLSQSDFLSNLNIKKENIGEIKENNNDFIIDNSDKNNNNSNKNYNNFENNDNNDNNEKLDILFSEVIIACPIIQLSADTSKVKIDKIKEKLN
jgi:hypothetical protein